MTTSTRKIEYKPANLVLCESCGHPLEFHIIDNNDWNLMHCYHSTLTKTKAPIGDYYEMVDCGQTCKYQSFPEGYSQVRYW